MRRLTALLAGLTGLLGACSDPPDPPRDVARTAEDRYAGRTPASDLARPFPETTAPATGDLGGGVPAAPVSPVDSRRRHELAPLIDALASAEGVDPDLVHAVISRESRYNPLAGSPKGAAGLMQLMPATAARFGLAPAERFDPAKNIRAGTRYLKVLLRLFGGNLDLALAGYNAGEGAVLKYSRRIPPYKETQLYVRLVKGYYAAYRQQARHRQTRTLLADVEQRRRVRALAGRGAGEREPTRERATGSEY